ncbi:MAG: exodeoxyribonuclease VII large subunit [Bacteroidales bacterium]|nr:exodeoxyribonuclease VII large subunit [Bacteroidales bacterium]
MSENSIHKNYYSLSQILESVSNVIKGAYRTPYWIKAEMIKLNHYPKSGHCYPDLVEKSDGTIKAQIRTTLWSGNYNKINAKFIDKLGKHLGDDMNILFLAEVKFDTKYGFSLNIIDIDADYELGVMAKSKADCINRLKTNNLYDKNKQLKLALLPQRVAIISDKTSKGYKDFLSIINNNSWGYKYFHMLFPSLLQGDAAVNTIIGQLKKIEKLKEHFDLVAIIRGGGGDVGMDCYNNYKLASEIANFPIPVISGIGHSSNETVVEMISNHNSITPTDLAYMLLQKFSNNAVTINDYQGVVEGFVVDYINDKMSTLNERYSFVVSKSKELLVKQNSLLQTLQQSTIYSTKAVLTSNNNRIEKITNENLFSIQKRLSIEEHKVSNNTKSLSFISKNMFVSQQQKLKYVEEKIELLKPENLLKKGYSYNTINNILVTDIKQVKIGDRLVTKTYTGEIESEITKIKRYE